MPYGLVILITKECGDISMACKWDIEVHAHWMWLNSKVLNGIYPTIKEQLMMDMDVSIPQKWDHHGDL